jgi:Uma2 family endonuclease
MAMLVLDQWVENRVKAEREVSGADRYDEVWDSVYVVMPPVDNEHQDVRSGLCVALHAAIEFDARVHVYAGVNVSDRVDGWLSDVRVPDIAVVLSGSGAQDCGTHYCGGPDFCAEIVSPGDRSRGKLDFYASVGVRELLMVDRQPWSLELYRLTRGRLESIGRSNLVKQAALVSTVVPVSFRLVAGPNRPIIEVAHHNGMQHWLV